MRLVLARIEPQPHKLVKDHKGEEGGKGKADSYTSPFEVAVGDADGRHATGTRALPGQPVPQLPPRVLCVAWRLPPYDARWCGECTPEGWQA